MSFGFAGEKPLSNAIWLQWHAAFCHQRELLEYFGNPEWTFQLSECELYSEHAPLFAVIAWNIIVHIISWAQHVHMWPFGGC